MATTDLTNAIGANTDTTDPFARLPNESFYEYLQRIKNLRGMLLGQYEKPADPVDDALADTIASQPLGQEVVRDGGDGDGGSQDTRTAEERKRDSLERAVGLLTGEAASGIGLGSIAGPLGMALGAFADYDTVNQFENQLSSLGYKPDQIEAIKNNPSMLQQGLQTGQFGVVSEGYKPTLVDKFSITGLFSDIFGDDKPSYSGPNVPGITGLGNVTAMTPTYTGAVNYAAPLQTNMLSWAAPGVGTVLAPGYQTGGTSSNMGWGSGVSGAGEGGFGGGDVSTVSTGGDTSFDTTTFDDIANDSSWGGGDSGSGDGGYGYGSSDSSFGSDDGWD